MVNVSFILRFLRFTAAITVAFVVFFFFIALLGLLLRTGKLGVPIGGPHEYAELIGLSAIFGFLFTPHGMLLWEYRMQPVNNRLWVNLSFCVVAKNEDLEKLKEGMKLYHKMLGGLWSLVAIPNPDNVFGECRIHTTFSPRLWARKRDEVYRIINLFNKEYWDREDDPTPWFSFTPFEAGDKAGCTIDNNIGFFTMRYDLETRLILEKTNPSLDCKAFGGPFKQFLESSLDAMTADGKDVMKLEERIYQVASKYGYVKPDKARDHRKADHKVAYR
jgi:hypothetical protein